MSRKKTKEDPELERAYAGLAHQQAIAKVVESALRGGVPEGDVIVAFLSGWQRSSKTKLRVRAS